MTTVFTPIKNNSNSYNWEYTIIYLLGGFEFGGHGARPGAPKLKESDKFIFYHLMSGLVIIFRADNRDNPEGGIGLSKIEVIFI